MYVDGPAGQAATGTRRLREVALRVPALRERADDALLLASRFLDLHARRYGLLAPRLTAVAARVIRHHDWPGNIRELERAMARAVIFVEGGWVRPEDLDLGPIGPVARASPRAASSSYGGSRRDTTGEVPEAPGQWALGKPIPCKVTSTDGEGEAGGYVFIAWKSDHPPRHVHVYRQGRLVVKWDLDHSSR